METLTAWKAATVFCLRQQLKDCPPGEARGVILTTMTPPVPVVAVVRHAASPEGDWPELHFWRVRFVRMPPEYQIAPMIEHYLVTATDELSMKTSASAIGSEMDVLVLEQLTGASINRCVSHHRDMLLSLQAEQ